MKALLRFILVLLIAVRWTPTFGGAHHATATQFETSKTVKLKGVVKKLDWANPHVHVYVDVKAERDLIEHWDVELASPGGIIVAGLSRDMLKPGTVLEFTGYPGKANISSRTSAEFSVCATQVTLTDGTTATFVVGI